MGEFIMKVFDLHSDLFTDIAWRKSRGEKNIFDRFHYPKLKEGGVDSIICVFWVEPKFRNHPYDRFQTLFQYVMSDLMDSKHAMIGHPLSDQRNNPDSEKIKIFFGVEGLTFMKDWKGETIEAKIENAFNFLHENKFIHLIFAWNERNFLATGTGAEDSKIKGLTDYGKIAVQMANKKNWILDVSHLDETSFWDMYNASELPVIASHSNARALCPHERNLTDEQIKAIAERGGIIGLNTYGLFVDHENPTIDKFIDHAIYIADLVGPEHVAFGFDFANYLESYDLGTEFNVYTRDLEDATKIPYLLEKMSKRGFTPEELESISFNNADHYIKKLFSKEKDRR
ncbi:membrane dipeptidase [Bacillus sp. FSL W8-0223]|jgi:membrane dipeptidase|uniref:dipeptidase n=2 Tax=unclassified Bacillus (in: firmicutes) TaxID=185979 RepID=UPI0030FCF5C0